MENDSSAITKETGSMSEYTGLPGLRVWVLPETMSLELLIHRKIPTWPEMLAGVL